MTGVPAAPAAGMMRWAEIDTEALRANAAAVMDHIGGNVGLMAMVKANGYGHGAVPAAQAFVAGGATWLGVSSAEEALQLIQAGLTASVLNVNWTHPANVPALIAAGVHMTVFDVESVAYLASTARQTRTPALVHLKVDTGMNRLGVRPEDLESVIAALCRAAPDVRVTGVFTHFADADGDDLAFTRAQAGRFDAMLPRLRAVFADALVHAANSAAILRLPQTHHDLVRAGIVLYGYVPPHCAGVVRVRGAMTMQACITQVKTVQPGDTVGYGCTWTASRTTRVAVVAAGYADGVFRTQSNRAVLLGQVRCPIIGQVSMDQISIDVSAAREARPGDVVTLIGGRDGVVMSADEVAAASGTMSREVLCAVSVRVPRVAMEHVRP